MCLSPVDLKCLINGSNSPNSIFYLYLLNFLAGFLVAALTAQRGRLETALFITLLRTALVLHVFVQCAGWKGLGPFSRSRAYEVLWHHQGLVLLELLL